VPKISILDRFISADLEEQPGILGATTTEYSDMEPLDWKWNNDVIIMSFRRSCSGDRGNICSGIANRFFKIQDECEDMKPELGEVESCQGAPTTISEPQPLTPTGVDCVSSTECEPGRCIEGKCYTLPTDPNCRNHGASEGVPNSFEKAFEITRIDGTTATGICNEQPTCSKSPDVYSVSQNEGKYLLSGATCSGRRGNCSEPRPNVEGEEQNIMSCEDYNGRANAIGLPDENDWVCSLNTAKKQLFSQNFTCTEPDDAAQCTIVPKEADPDSDQRLCDACRLAPSPRPVHTGAWIESRDICCGDDAGEGGFPYTTTTSGTISAHRASEATTPAAGTYGAEVCDDYYGIDKYLQSNWIDNDCDGKVACKDTAATECGGTVTNYANWRKSPLGFDAWKNKLGPTGGLCCGAEPATDTAKNNCKQFLDPTPWTSPTDANLGVACNSVNYTCDCTPVGIEKSRTLTVTSTPLVIRTCVASYDELLAAGNLKDRNFTISGSHIFVVSVEDIDQSSPQSCTYGSGGTVSLSTYVGGFYFENRAEKDCLVTVTIT
jgi:hypothetical protein